MKKLLVIAFVLFSLHGFSQKFGHCNIAEIAQEMPELKVAETQFSAKTDELEGRLKRMFEVYQTKVDEFQSKAEGMTPDEQSQAADEIKNLEVRIQEAQQNSQAELAAYDQELKTPILDKVKEAVKAVSVENNYAMIFDLATGTVLYAGGDDVTDLVKAKLGLQ